MPGTKKDDAGKMDELIVPPVFIETEIVCIVFFFYLDHSSRVRPSILSKFTQRKESVMCSKTSKFNKPFALSISVLFGSDVNSSTMAKAISCKTVIHAN